jgi:hypothetical protein
VKGDLVIAVPSHLGTIVVDAFIITFLHILILVAVIGITGTVPVVTYAVLILHYSRGYGETPRRQ